MSAMNCDQVFDILTRGPFPTGTLCDADVEAHLNQCPECRRLAEALRPAIELFQEAVAPEESRDLPGYWCAVATDRRPPPAASFQPKLEKLAAAPADWSTAAAAPRWSALAAWRMAAMLALGVTLGLLVNSRLAFDGLSAVPPVTRSTAVAAPGDGDDRTPRLSPALQAELAVRPSACSRNQPAVGPRNTLRGDRLLLDANLQLGCCSECHHAHSDVVPPSATAQVSQRCQLCHKEPAALE